MSLVGVISLRVVAYKAEMASRLFGGFDHTNPTVAQHVACLDSAYSRLDPDGPLSGCPHPVAIQR